MKIFFDGGCRPAGMELAVVVAGARLIRDGLGPGDAMTAKWLALIAAVRVAAARGIADAVLLGDSAAVIAQARGEARCPPAYRACLERFHALPRPPGRMRIRWIGRSQNLAGIALAARHPR